MHFAETLLNFVEFIDIVDKLHPPTSSVSFVSYFIILSYYLYNFPSETFFTQESFVARHRKIMDCYLLIESLMDSFHPRDISLYDNCEKLNAYGGFSPGSFFARRWPPPPSAQVATKVSL